MLCHIEDPVVSYPGACIQTAFYVTVEGQGGSRDLDNEIGGCENVGDIFDVLASQHCQVRLGH